jgi:hypothetical protein
VKQEGRREIKKEMKRRRVSRGAGNGKNYTTLTSLNSTSSPL